MRRNKTSNSLEFRHKNTNQGSAKLTVILLILLLVLVGGVGIKFGMDYQKMKLTKENHQTAITSDVLRQQMEAIGELATVKYYYTNMGKYEDNVQMFDHKVPFTTKSFTISYDGVIKAGIDLDQVEISVEGNVVNVVMPQVQILSHDVDMDTVTVYDEKNSIFNGLETKDVTNFLSDQNSLMEEKARNSGIMTEAKENAATALRYLFQTFLNQQNLEESYTLCIQSSEEQN